MKRYVLLVVILLFTSSGVCLAKTVKKHYPNGALQAVTGYNGKGVRHGRYTTYWANGKVMERGTYKNGKLVGLVRRYSIDGELLAQ
jgi:antitoxin component YwqK of YwqJK toxin-antitoxin module